MPLQSGMGEVDRTFGERFVQVAAAYQNKVDGIAGEFQQQSFARVVLPRPKQSIAKPSAVAVPETELYRGGRVAKAAKIAKRLAFGFHALGIRFLLRRFIRKQDV